MIQSKRRLLTAFSFTGGRENPTVSILLAIVNIPSLDLFISNTYFFANKLLSFDLCAMSVKTKEHFYAEVPFYTNHYSPGLYVELYSPIHSSFLAAWSDQLGLLGNTFPLLTL